MGRDEERWLGPGEAAAKLGVTVKALRVYEREGLVKPARTAGGWRAYGPTQIARIHMIIVMRELGLSLKNIGALLDGKTPSLVPLLTAQQEALEDKRRRIGSAIALLMDARLKLAQGRSLSPDDLTQLSRETVMQNFEDHAEVEARVERFVERHLASEEIALIKDEVRSSLAANGRTEEDMVSELTIFMGEARRLMAKGDPDSEAAKAAVRRWAEITKGIKPPAPEVRAAWQKGLNEAMADPSLAPELPFDPQVLAFIRQVADGMKAGGELA